MRNWLCTLGGGLALVIASDIARFMREDGKPYWARIAVLCCGWALLDLGIWMRRP